jgi:hypothetical protein
VMAPILKDSPIHDRPRELTTAHLDALVEKSYDERGLGWFAMARVNALMGGTRYGAALNLASIASSVGRHELHHRRYSKVGHKHLKRGGHCRSHRRSLGW